jgi:hypothetical protein
LLQVPPAMYALEESVRNAEQDTELSPALEHVLKVVEFHAATAVLPIQPHAPPVLEITF